MEEREFQAAKAGGVNRKDGVNPLYLVTSKSENSNLASGGVKCSNDPGETVLPLSSEELNKVERSITKNVIGKGNGSRRVHLARTLKTSSTLSSYKTAKVWAIPAQSCTEMIVICLDISKDMRKTFTSPDVRGRCNFTQIIEKALKVFMSSKLNMSSSHRFALMFLSNDCLWINDFTSDLNTLLSLVREAPECNVNDVFEISDIFDAMAMKYGESLNKCLSNFDFSDVTVCSYRLLIVYGRTTCVPKIDFKQKHSVFRTSERFTVDVLYLFSDEIQNNIQEKIFYNLGELDFHGNAYIFAVNKPCEVFECFAQLLGHPFQRPFQQHIHHVLED